MGSPAEKHQDTSLIESVVDVLEAGQRVVLDRVELLSVEARLLLSTSVTSVALVLAGLALLLVGWVAANVLLILTLAPAYWTHAQAIALVAGVNVASGAAALAVAKQRAGRVAGGSERVRGASPGGHDGGALA